MTTRDTQHRQLDSSRARRLVGSLCLRPGERVLCLGHGSKVAARLAAYLVGPTGQVVETDYDLVVATGSVPFADGEFDAVLTDLATVADPDHTRVLTEVGRVTAATGRVAFAAVPPADGDPAPVYAVAADAGLRGAFVRPDAGPRSDAEPVLLVTAFPPLAAGATNKVGSTGERPISTVTTAALDLRALAGRGGRRGRLVAAAVAVMVLAIAAGVGWGLSGADGPSGEPGLAAGGSGAGGEQPAGSDQPGTSGESGDGGAPDGGPVSGAGSGSGPGSGTESGSSGGGPPDNQPPVIEDPGLSSDGLALTIAPTVTDPDGDDLSLSFEVDGDQVPTPDPGRAEVVFDEADVDSRHDASVTITATDSRGASSWATFTHTLVATTTVTVRDVRFTVAAPGSCFGGGNGARRLTGRLTLAGPVADSIPFNEELRIDRTEVLLLDSRTGEDTTGDPRQSVILQAGFAGQVDSLSQVHSGRKTVFKALFTATDGCRGLLHYAITFQQR